MASSGRSVLSGLDTYLNWEEQQGEQKSIKIQQEDKINAHLTGWKIWKSHKLFTFPGGILISNYLLPSRPRTCLCGENSSIPPPSVDRLASQTKHRKVSGASTSTYFRRPTLIGLNIAQSSAHRLGNNRAIFSVMHLRKRNGPVSDGNRMCVAWLHEPIPQEGVHLLQVVA